MRRNIAQTADFAESMTCYIKQKNLSITAASPSASLGAYLGDSASETKS